MTPTQPRPLPPEVQAALGVLAAQYRLPASAVPRLGGLLEHLAARPHAPTTVRSPAQALDVHIADSLVALDIEGVRTARRIADLGAGAGFPGLVLAAAIPDAEVALVESVARKGLHVSEAIQHAGIPNAHVVTARAEDWAQGTAEHDLITARALAPLAVVAEYAAPLLSDGGTLLAWKGRLDAAEMESARRAAEILGLELDQPVAVTPFAGADHRHLVTLRKVAPTPPRFPRRAGVAQRKPLG